MENPILTRIAAATVAALDPEANCRRSRADQVEHLFRSPPGQWISAGELATVGGFCGWRTRVADVRRRVEDAGQGTVEWNGDVRGSAYRWLPRCATAPALVASQPTLF